VNRPLRDFEAARKLGGRQPPVDLQEQHDGKQSVGAHPDLLRCDIFF
jgi:hypothetical protein